MPILRANPPDLGKNRANGGSGLKSSPKVPPGPPKMALQRKMGGVPEMGGGVARIWAVFRIAGA